MVSYLFWVQHHLPLIFVWLSLFAAHQQEHHYFHSIKYFITVISLLYRNNPKIRHTARRLTRKEELMPRNNRSTTTTSRGSGGGGGGSLVYNPFKPQRKLWIRYVMLLLLALGLTWMVIVLRSTTTNTMNSAVTVDTASSSFAAVGDDKNDNNNNANDDELQQDDTLGASSQDLENDDNEKDEDADDDEDDEDDDVQEFPQHLPLDEFPAWIHKYLNKLDWPAIQHEDDDYNNNNELWLNRDILLESLALGCDNLQANQLLPAGNFNYQYDFVQRTFDPTDSEVRQAGALWGLSLCYQYYFDDGNNKYKAAIEKGLQFFMNLTVPGPNHKGDDETTLMVRYPDAQATQSATGTNALFGLAMLEYLQTTTTTTTNGDNDDFVKEVREVLHKIIAHLVQAQLVSAPNSPHFAQAYYFGSQTFQQSSSPYFDGEVLLCLTKAAKYYDNADDQDDLRTLVEDSVFGIAKKYTLDAWASSVHDSDQTKGFYQWSSMALTEYCQSQWNNYKVAGDLVLALGHWILHVHNILQRTRNTGYAFEGLISAYRIAQDRGNTRIVQHLETAIDRGLYKITTWQVGGPLQHENNFLQAHPTNEAMAVGGVMNAKNQAPLRIDTTQHQMHAVILALNHVYTSTSSSTSNQRNEAKSQ